MQAGGENGGSRYEGEQNGTVRVSTAHARYWSVVAVKAGLDVQGQAFGFHPRHSHMPGMTAQISSDFKRHLSIHIYGQHLPSKLD